MTESIYLAMDEAIASLRRNNAAMRAEYNALDESQRHTLAALRESRRVVRALLEAFDHPDILLAADVGDTEDMMVQARRVSGR